MTRKRAMVAVVGGMLVGLAFGTPSAQAAFPGANGRITFAQFDGGSGEVYSVRRSGGGLINLTEHPARDFDPAYSPDGSKIAFASTRAGVREEIFIMNADGSDPTQITDNGRTEDTGPAFSPDGRQLVITQVLGEDADESLAIVDIATGQVTPIPDLRFPACPLPLECGIEGAGAAWSPRGDLIAFHGSTFARNSEIMTVRPDGTDFRVLTDSPGFDGDPNWSPDGTRIAFSSDRSGNGDIYTMAADGSNLVRVTKSDRLEFGPAWSPSGQLIAFARAFTSTTFQSDIFTVTPTGKDVTRVTRVQHAQDADWGVEPPG
jgi:Tol biopolymer transport system component